MEFMRKSLSQRLAGYFLLLSLLTVTVISFVCFQQAKQALTQSVVRQLEIEASLTERELTRWLEGQQRSFLYIASSPEMRQQAEALARDLDNLPGHEHQISYSFVSEMLGSALAHNPDFQELFLLSDMGGKILCSTDPKHEGEYRVSDLYFVQGRTATFVQSLYPSPMTGKPTITIASAMFDQKQLQRLGVLVVHLNFEALDRIIQRPNGVDEETESYLVDKLHLTASSRRFGTARFPRGVQSQGIDLALAGKQGSGLYLNYDQLPVMGAYRWIVPLNLALLTEIPKSKALAPANRLANTILIIGFLSAAILALAVQRLARQIVHPILAIEKTATQVASGDLGQKAPVTTEDEVGVLARTFNEMTEKLRGLYQGLESEVLSRRQAEEMLREKEELLQSIINNTTALIHVKHPDGRYLLVNNQFEKLFNVAFEQIKNKTAHDLFPGEIADAFRANDRQVLETLTTLQFEERVPHCDGIHTYVSVRFPLLDAAGRLWATCCISTDITERKQSEEALRKSEEQLRMLLETTAVIAWEADAQTWQFNYVARSAEKILGYPLSDWFQQDFWSSHIHPEDRERVIDFCRTASGSCTDFEFDYRMIAADQRVVWIHDLVHVVVQGDTPRIIRGFLIDVTESKRTEEALQESQRRYALATAAGRVGVWDWNLETNEIYVDLILKLTLGYQDHEILNPMDVWSRLVHPEDKQQFLSRIRSHFRAGTPHFESEHRMLHKDGRALWFLARGTVMRDPSGRPYRVMLTSTEITQQKQTLDALQFAEELKRGVLDSLGDHIAVLDRKGTIIDVNAVWYQFAFENGATAKNLLGPGTNYLEIGRQASGEFSETAQQTIDGIQSVLDGREKSFSLEYRCPSRMEDRWFLMTVTPLRRGDGGAVVAHTNITERKRAEEALRRSQKELQDLAARILSAQEEEHRRLARELHDDLTQKLAVLALDIGKLERQNLALPAGVCHMLGTMKEQIVKLSADIHGISRQLHPSILDDLGLVDAIRSECYLFSEREGIQVLFLPEGIPEDLPKEVSLCIYRVTQEGLRNIAKHAQTKQARVALRLADSNLQLTIQDRGIGFDPAGNRRRPGLGLASMKERTRFLQASLSIQSEPGTGTTITALIPLPKRAAEVAARSAGL